MERNELKSVIESLIFVSEEPMTPELMAIVFEEEGIKKKEIKEVIAEITEEWKSNPERGIELVEVAGGYQFRTKSEMADWIKKLNVPKPVRLSQAALETMAIIAYRQPVMRADIENIRGVDSGGVLKTLLEKGLIRILGKGDEAGNPLLYGTTKAFLEIFSLNSLKELPTLKEIESLEVQDKVGQLGKDELDKQNIKNGVEEVVDEYKEDITAYAPDPTAIAEDNLSLANLESSIKNLRNLEKDIFPKPKEEIQVVDKETGQVVEGAAPETTENTQTVTEGTENETTPPQDTGGVN